MTSLRVLRLCEPFLLENGAMLDGVEVAYRTWGRLDADASNAVLVCHALTGSADAETWWPDLFGRAIDPAVDFVICTNVLGGCYGTTGPTTPGPRGESWGPDFPAISIRDGARLQAKLLEHLGVRRLRLVIGGSMGGMHALEWPLLFPDRVDSAVVIASSARHSPWCIGWSEAQRLAIAADPKWRGGRYPADDPPRDGLAAARAMAMVSYRSWPSFEDRFGRELRPGRDGSTSDSNSDENLFEVESWLRYHGGALVDRFDANTYVTLTRTMDSHDVGRGRGGVREALRRVEQPVLVVSIDTDVLYPPVEQQRLAALLPRGELFVLRSDHGHDGFLIDMEPLAEQIADFRRARRERAPGLLDGSIDESFFESLPDDELDAWER